MARSVSWSHSQYCRSDRKLELVFLVVSRDSSRNVCVCAVVLKDHCADCRYTLLFPNLRYSLIKKHMRKNEEGKLSPVQHLTASAEAGMFQA